MLGSKTALSIALAGLLVGPVIASAATPLAPRGGDISEDRQYIYQGGEEGWAPRPHEYGFRNGAMVRTDDRSITSLAPADRLPPQPGEVSADRQYIYLGGESGWVPRPHEYGPAAGAMAHSDDRPMNLPTPATRDRQPPSQGDVSADGYYVYRGGEEGWVTR